MRSGGMRRRGINRLKKKKTEPFYRRPLLLRSVLLLGVLAFIITAGLMLYRATEGWMRVREIEVVGNRLLSDREVLKMMGIRKGTSLFRVSSQQVRQRLLSSPWIRDACVRKEPPHRMVVYLREVRPVALLKRPDGLYLIDKRGKLLERVSNMVASLPVLRVDPANRELLSEAILLARTIWRDEFFGDRQVTIVGKRPEDLTILVDGNVIKVGKGNYRDKLFRFLEVEEKIRENAIPVEYVDLRFDRRVVVRMKKGAGSG